MPGQYTDRAVLCNQHLQEEGGGKNLLHNSPKRERSEEGMIAYRPVPDYILDIVNDSMFSRDENLLMGEITYRLRGPCFLGRGSLKVKRFLSIATLYSGLTNATRVV